MSARALAKLGLAPIPHIDLPVGSRPQIVNEAGYEIDEEELVKDVADAPTPEDGEVEAGDVEMEEGVKVLNVEQRAEEDKGEPLLSLADRCVHAAT
jgi:hypothetical protein